MKRMPPEILLKINAVLAPYGELTDQWSVDLRHDGENTYVDIRLELLLLAQPTSEPTEITGGEPS